MNRRGFTLLELMLVSLIILAMTAVSTPLFRRTYEDLKLTSCVKEITVMMQFCRDRAVFERRLYRFFLDSDNKTFHIMVRDDEDEEFTPLESRWGRVFRIPGSIQIETDTGIIDFPPDGSPTGAVIYLSNNKNVTHTILVEQNTGRIKKYDYKKAKE